MILDVKCRRRNNIPPLPQTSSRRLEQSFRFVSRPLDEDNDLEKEFTHLFNEVSILFSKLKKGQPIRFLIYSKHVP